MMTVLTGLWAGRVLRPFGRLREGKVMEITEQEAQAIYGLTALEVKRLADVKFDPTGAEACLEDFRRQQFFRAYSAKMCAKQEAIRAQRRKGAMRAREAHPELASLTDTEVWELHAWFSDRIKARRAAFGPDGSSFNDASRDAVLGMLSYAGFDVLYEWEFRQSQGC